MQFNRPRYISLLSNAIHQSFIITNKTNDSNGLYIKQYITIGLQSSDKQVFP